MFGLSIMKIQHMKTGGVKLKHCLEKELCRYIHRKVYNGCKGVGRGRAETDSMDYAILYLQKSILQTFHKSIKMGFHTCENVCVGRRNKIQFNVLIHIMKRRVESQLLPESHLLSDSCCFSSHSDFPHTDSSYFGINLCFSLHLLSRLGYFKYNWEMNE